MKHPHVVMAGAILLTIGTLLQVQAQGVPTKVMVRAVSRDAKVIGDKVGGALALLYCQRAGEVTLALLVVTWLTGV